ncbi:uncharacterized protein LOC124900093 [Capsicum annuum]|uniref:uncharacterized protein LOC124900093 n=1 Tax=Capsicum annuum TaxID=4072 RepID=UPI001FB09B08|nr:uncharacterized protein LOC124900093 [Capsicum annuum]
MEEPVLSSIQIGHHNQTILYEGDGYLCTSCGRFGHIRLRCLYQKLTPPMAPSNQGTALAPSDHEEWHTVKFPSRKNGKGGRNTPLPTKTQFPTKARVATEHTEAKIITVNLETPPSPPIPRARGREGQGTMGVRMTSFTEISNFKNSALMIFPENEEKKYIHLCPATILKSSFDLRPAINAALAKYAVVMTPTLCCSQFSATESSQSSLNFFSPMNQATCFIVWNTRGVNNDNFKMNFRDLINSHNPCFVALLETKRSNHLGLMYDFGFDDYWEVPAIGRSGGIVLLWHTSFVSITRKRQTSQELHVMIKVNVEERGESSGAT